MLWLIFYKRDLVVCGNKIEAATAIDGMWYRLERLPCNTGSMNLPRFILSVHPRSTRLSWAPSILLEIAPLLKVKVD